MMFQDILRVLPIASGIVSRDNAAGIGDNSEEISDNAAGIVDIAAKVIPC